MAWLSSRMYSSVPTRGRRVNMLKRIRGVLKNGGRFICWFRFEKGRPRSPRAEAARKAIGFLTLGNSGCEPGDALRGNFEFMHSFSSKKALLSEFEAGGFDVIRFFWPEEGAVGGVVLKPTPRPPN